MRPEISIFNSKSHINFQLKMIFTFTLLKRNPPDHRFKFPNRYLKFSKSSLSDKLGEFYRIDSKIDSSNDSYEFWFQDKKFKLIFYDTKIKGWQL